MPYGRRFLPGGATVLLDGDRIVGVETGRVDVSDGVEVTACAGAVLPGLIDCHTHLVADATFGGLERAAAMPDEAIRAVIMDSQRAHAVARVTTVRDLGDPGTDQLGAQFSVAQLAALVDEAHGTGLPVVAHAHSLLGMQNALAAGVDGIEHFTGITSDGPRIDDQLLDEVASWSVYVDLTMDNDRAPSTR
jgi:imidazolonepropionase-like amidohydrolase